MSYLFSKPTFVSSNDPYLQHKPRSSREKGAQFTTNPTKGGRAGKGCYFADLTYKPDKYIDPGLLESEYKKKRANEMKKHLRPITEPFRYSNPGKKTCGSGSYYGCIGASYEHKSPDPVSKKGRKKVDVDNIKRNFITNPPKKGTYGFSGTTLQKDLYKYNKPDPYDTHRDYTNKMNKQTKAKMVGKEPFKASGSTRAYFHPDSEIYTIPDNIKNMKKKVKKKKEVQIRPEAFKPGSPCRGTFSKFPEYIPTVEKKVKKKKEEPREVFRPTGVSKTGPSRSIIFGSTRGLF